MQPKVSVLMPGYNAEASLLQALNSIRVQTFADLEILIWNDGSDDRSAEILDAAALSDERIRLFGTANNFGIVHALNGLIAEARAPLLARMDADDVMHPQRIEKQFEMMQLQPQCGLVSCIVAHGGNEISQKGYAEHITWLNTLRTPEEIKLNRFVESPLAHPSVMFRAELVTQLGGYRKGDFPEDYELWLRWLNAGVEMRKAEEKLLIWNDPPNRLSRISAYCSPDAFSRIKAVYLATEINRIAASRAIWLCGAGRITRRRSNYLLQQGISIAGYIDVNPELNGKTAGGFPVIAPQQIPPPENCIVVSYISNRGARTEIARMLEEKGFVNGKDYILAG
ncbi:MAG: glycosyltransferase family 2 protein [Bacteroidia bacterium]